nr:CesT family type III secretion system chaperone [Acanthopleuribacter pedis]
MIQRLGWETPPQDEQGRSILSFDGDLHVALYPENRHRLLAEGFLFALPEERSQAEALAAKVLQMNLAGMRRRRQAIAVDEHTNQLILFRRFDSQAVSLEKFETALADFIDDMELFRGLNKAATGPSLLTAGF